MLMEHHPCLAIDSVIYRFSSILSVSISMHSWTFYGKGIARGEITGGII